MSALLAPIFVHDVRASDLDAIADLERRAFPVPWKREYFSAEVGAPHRFNRVVRDEKGSLVGYVFCAFAAGEIHVNKIAVEGAWRRRGVARLLMEEVLRLGERIAAEEIYLEVRLSNAAARSFYRVLGFHETGTRRAYYLDGEDALVMVRMLGQPKRGGS